jgi:hypothetical protein
MAGLYQYQNKYRYQNKYNYTGIFYTGIIENGSNLRYTGIISCTAVAVYSHSIIQWIRCVNAGAWNAR